MAVSCSSRAVLDAGEVDTAAPLCRLRVLTEALDLESPLSGETFRIATPVWNAESMGAGFSRLIKPQQFPVSKDNTGNRAVVFEFDTLIKTPLWKLSDCYLTCFELQKLVNYRWLVCDYNEQLEVCRRLL
ncbi:hypothetical protein J6590_079276 [Homalodisca vitripennis]|nr:hypothetical protein J6590_079276 [Homalodisca vitripennis]